ncbi:MULTISPECIES: helix-turn-helix domain-containing protein [Curtobacterium]|uniref:helix-turn-helix domain-containing protein n=1 Tax=Curtobacterium TaxID=2034 RepID=UPI0006F550BA|nr:MULTISPECIES: helix-turn-helix transcriptional regulator [Curtobacterium]KQR31102.1 hypothetical protein ASF75_06625 [Curtobacterium sp. Leaf154]MBT1674650.1 helix-turn-helix transcriptional regulator [Curtobacterium flaccumfaciens pv. flaccumfaciens]SDQ57393.1 Helix-turn-helix [Curtobacterium sp. UNCCL20]
MTIEFDDGLGFEAEETPSERLARQLADADLQLIAQIRAKRIELGLSQAELGRMLHISQATVSEFESGMTEPKMQTVRRYAHALGLLIEHSVRDVDATYEPGRDAVEIELTSGARFTAQTGSYTALANSKRTDFAIAA